MHMPLRNADIHAGSRAANTVEEQESAAMHAAAEPYAADQATYSSPLALYLASPKNRDAEFIERLPN